jgi:serine O-acetyltransferase
MKIPIGESSLFNLVSNQVQNLFMAETSELVAIKNAFPEALKRSSHCFSASTSKYYWDNHELIFNPYHSGQYTIFLYFLANQLWRVSPNVNQIANKIYYLNKTLNGLDIYYEIETPSIFFLDHPVGSVLGRAKYGEGFSFSQNCTVGNNHGIYPTIGKNVTMHLGSKILGKCQIGDNAVISANSYIIDQDVPEGALVFGVSPNLVFKSPRVSK